MSHRNKFRFEQQSNEQRYHQGMAKETRRRKLQETGKQHKRSSQRKPPRQKHWEADAGDWDDVEMFQYERIMPRGERERRRAVEKAAFKARTQSSTTTQPETQHDGLRGLVVEVSTGLCRVDIGGRSLLCRPRGTLRAQDQQFSNLIAVGDEVIINEDGSGGGVIEEVLPRRSALTRPDVFYSHLRQVIVANVDQLLIVGSWREPTLWMELIDRYLIAAERGSLQSIICINKVDLVADEALFQATLEPYRRLGYQLLLTSARTGAGIAELRALLANRVTVVAGLSGVGKSSLLTAVQPTLQLRTGTVSTTSKHMGEGRHTTTQATLLRLDAGGAVVDTPGIREFGLSGLRQTELRAYFPEFAEPGSNCRFADCVHLEEPGCAVRSAVDAGIVAASRYHSYRKIYEDLPA